MPDITNKIHIEYLKQFRYIKDDLLIELETFAFHNKIPILDWLSVEFLKQMLIIHKPKNILEIGCAIAYSTIIIAQSISDDAKVITIEKSIPNIKLAEQNIQRANLQNKIELLQGDAIDIIPDLKQNFDFIFLDADKEDYIELFNLSLPKLNKNGIFFIDNLLWHGDVALKRAPKKRKASVEIIKKFNQIFMNNSQLISNIYPIGDGIGIGIKS